MILNSLSSSVEDACFLVVSVYSESVGTILLYSEDSKRYVGLPLCLQNGWNPAVIEN